MILIIKKYPSSGLLLRDFNCLVILFLLQRLTFQYFGMNLKSYYEVLECQITALQLAIIGLFSMRYLQSLPYVGQFGIFCNWCNFFSSVLLALPSKEDIHSRPDFIGLPPLQENLLSNGRFKLTVCVGTTV